MPDLLLELFSEEIPARMQARAADDLARLLSDALAPLSPDAVQTFHGPRRIALIATLRAEVPASTTTERGPRASAPEQALTGFLRKHGAAREQLVREGEHWVLTLASPATPAATLVAAALPPLLRRFPWPKSMRWGDGSGFTWVRPLRRILCLLDGTLVPFALADGDDDGHGLVSGTETEGHRFHAPGPFIVSSFAEWHDGLRARRVIPAAGERRRLIEDGIAALAAAEGLQVVPDDGLLDEVAGLVEWPVPLLGRIDAAFMDLPPEVMQVSMRVNQRYFSTRHPDGTAADRFAFAANIEASDGGAVIVAGNERVLRARFSDARYFWNLDRQTPLADRVAALHGVTFHAELGSQGDRVRRLVRLARHIAPMVGADPALAERAALLAKADLTTGMVGEFPELQGVMGGYYAAHDGEPAEVAAAIHDHYSPKGPKDAVPLGNVTVAVAVADKIDQLAAFFSIGEAPTGSGDPYALRRAALGVIRLILENKGRVGLRSAFILCNNHLKTPVPVEDVLNFVKRRLRDHFYAHPMLSQMPQNVFLDDSDDNLLRLYDRKLAWAVASDRSVYMGFWDQVHRATNIVQIEAKKDGPYLSEPKVSLAQTREESELIVDLRSLQERFQPIIGHGDFATGWEALRAVMPQVRNFLDNVMVNDPDPATRLNRLQLLNGIVELVKTLQVSPFTEGLEKP